VDIYPIPRPIEGWCKPWPVLPPEVDKEQAALVLRSAKRKLWDGQGQRKGIHYICNAVRVVPICPNVVGALLKLIQLRLNYAEELCPTYPCWLDRQHPTGLWALTHQQEQEARHYWLDQLIEEFTL